MLVPNCEDRWSKDAILMVKICIPRYRGIFSNLSALVGNNAPENYIAAERRIFPAGILFRVG